MKMKNWVELVGEDKIFEMRKAAKPANKQALWIGKYLDDEQMAELYYRIFEKGEDLKKLAKMVRDAWGVKPNWQLQDFYRGMEKWKRRLATPMSAIISRRQTKDELKRARKLKAKSYKAYKNLNVLGRLGYAIEIQLERLDLMHEKEKQHNVAIDTVDTIQNTLNNLTSNYVTMALKTGILQGIPSEINVNFKDKSDRVLAFIGGDAMRLVRTANDYLETIEKKAVPIDIDPTTGKVLLECSKKI